MSVHISSGHETFRNRRSYCIFFYLCTLRHDPTFDKSKLPSMKDMTAGQRCAARWCQGSQDHKNGTLKIVPAVVDGPWVVKSVVGSKPAIIGNKLPGKHATDLITSTAVLVKRCLTLVRLCHQ